MSPDPARGGERRAHYRYPLSLDVLCSVERSDRVFSAKTVNISSGGVCFSCPEVLVPRERIELAILWPVLLGGTSPLQLKVTANVLRQDKRGTAVEILRYRLHTRKRQPDWTTAPQEIQVA